MIASGKSKGLASIQRVINGLADHIAILDSRATTVLVNSAWSRFAEANGLRAPDYGLGVNYLELCDSVNGPCSETAGRVARGLRELLRRKSGEFVCEYPCHGPSEKRWFQVRGTCLVQGASFYIILAHQNITQAKFSEEALASSEAKLRALLDATTESALLMDLEGTILAVNETGATRLGFSREAILGRNLFALLPPALAAERKARAQQVIAGREPARFQDVREGRAYDVCAYPVFNSQGNVTMLAIFASDITERKAVEEKATWLASFPESNPDPIVEVDLGANIVAYSNPAASRLFPDLQQNGLNHPWVADLGSAGETLRSGEAPEVRREITIGESCYAQSITRVSHSQRFRIYSIDITARKKAEEALEHARAELKAHADKLERAVAERTAELKTKVAELEAFSYSLSHDMRAPVRAMRCYCEIVREQCVGKVDDSMIALLDKIAGAASRMDSLIVDVLALTRISSQRIQLHRVRLEQLVRDVIQERPELQPPRASIQIRSPLAVVLGHEASLTQCLSNLLTNAVKFVAPGVHPRVEVSTEILDGRVRLSVRDNGIGIAPDEQEKIFEIFHRLFPGRYEGTGMGLAIVRKAVERMGGKVGLESEVERGSTFWIELPRA